MKIVTAAQMRALDRQTIQEARIPSLTLMERAGAGTVSEMQRFFGLLKGRRITILCGKGHNGGDGLVVARLLVKQRAIVRVLLLHPVTELAPDTRTMYRRLLRLAGRRLIDASPSAEHLSAHVDAAEILVDALLGTGLSSPVTGRYQSAIEVMNESGHPIVAVDLPSGLHADSGACLGAAVRATLTVTFGLPKYGLYLGDGIDLAGVVRVVDIGIPAEYAAAVDSPAFLLSGTRIAELIPARPPSAHKGTFGHAGIIAGAVGKSGAAALAAKAALRVGTGLVTVATPAGVNATIESKLLEAMTQPIPDTADHQFGRCSIEALVAFAQRKTGLAIGPGIGTDPETMEAVRRLLPQLLVPCVVDADALSAAAELPSPWAQCNTPMILTPHPGEMARLTGMEHGQAVNRDRAEIARGFAQRHRVIVVLKGARTVLGHPDGRIAVCPTGNPGLATGGTGDVLTGMIAGLLAQRLPPWDAACAGTYLHGLAGDLAAAVKGQAGLIAGDVIEQIPHAITHLTP